MPNLRVFEEIDIKTPCSVPWGEIQGSGQIRSCQVCRKNVVDLIEFTTFEAARILNEPGSLPCVRICRASDGRIVTADNPAGIGIRIWRGLRRRSAWAASLFGLLFLPGCSLLDSFFTYGAPVRYIKPAEPETTVSSDSAQPKAVPEKTTIRDD
jgi:hypothetical protein